MTTAFDYFLREIRSTLSDAQLPDVDTKGSGALPSVYAVTDLTAASIGSAMAELAALSAETLGHEPSGTVEVDQRLASFWFKGTIQPQGWKLPPVWDDIAGVYPGADGWIRLHTNAPHHRAAVLHVLDCPGNKDAVGAAVARYSIETLEEEVVAAGGCAAAMRSEADWRAHPNGVAITHEPLIDQVENGTSSTARLEPDFSRPLKGLRVLDLTRVLAGPVCTRFLAGWGADVLRLDPLDWEEGIVIPEVVLGKRCARIDLKERSGRATFEQLLADADVLVHGYRADALDRLGVSADARQQIRPGLIDVCLDAYGWTGPWAPRRGFDSLVQMSCGIAHAGMRAVHGHEPLPLPAQALDHATGYLMATATVRALRTRLATATGTRIRCSLARTAYLLMNGPAGNLDDNVVPLNDADWSDGMEATSWGPARRLRPPAAAEGLRMSWDLPAGELGRHAPTWRYL